MKKGHRFYNKFSKELWWWINEHTDEVATTILGIFVIIAMAFIVLLVASLKK